jgi:uncharacterized membrane protein
MKMTSIFKMAAVNEGLSPSFFLGEACIIAGVILVSVKNRVTD